jgi:hypothetical protein
VSEYNLDELLQEVKIPDNLDITGRSFLVHLFEKASRRVIGSGLVDNKKITYFKEGIGSLKQLGDTLGWLNPLRQTITIEINNPFISPFTASITLTNSDGISIIPDPDALTVWTIEYTLNDGTRYSNSFPNGRALEQVLHSTILPNTEIKITARALEYYGELTFLKQPSGNLHDLILITELSGLNYPPVN